MAIALQGYGLILCMSILQDEETCRYSTKLCSSVHLFQQTSIKVANINSEACDYYLSDLGDT